jgi:RNAse (barnase) inhibitor barstar
MDKITLNFTGCKYLGELHKVIKEGFGFPDYYGENWSALWDCLRYYCNSQLKVEIMGVSSLNRDFDESVQVMLEIFNDVHAESPNIEFVLIS